MIVVRSCGAGTGGSSAKMISLTTSNWRGLRCVTTSRTSTGAFAGSAKARSTVLAL
jgi:hypothetical protein